MTNNNGYVEQIQNVSASLETLDTKMTSGLGGKGGLIDIPGQGTVWH